jgi:hypothetical protein
MRNVGGVWKDRKRYNEKVEIERKESGRVREDVDPALTRIRRELTRTHSHTYHASALSQ